MIEIERPKVTVKWLSQAPNLMVNTVDGQIIDIGDEGDEGALYTDVTVAEMTAYSARVSNPSNQANTLTMPKLLDYLQKHRHWSPFQMTHVCVLIERLPRSIAHQMIRHSSLAFQEFSQRYSILDGDIQPIIWEPRLKGASNRQSSIETDDPDIHDRWEQLQRKAWWECWDSYVAAVYVGIAPEVARSVLPEGLTPTTLFAAGTVRSWIHYLEARLAPDAQKEHRVLAEEIRNAFVETEFEFAEILPSGVKAEGQL